MKVFRHTGNGNPTASEPLAAEPFATLIATSYNVELNNYQASTEKIAPPLSRGTPMEYDEQKIAEAVLALLGVFEFENGRVWKRIDFGVMDELFEKGYISNPKGKSESVYLTQEGMQLAKQLAA